MLRPPDERSSDKKGKGSTRGGVLSKKKTGGRETNLGRKNFPADQWGGVRPNTDREGTEVACSRKNARDPTRGEGPGVIKAKPPPSLHAKQHGRKGNIIAKRGEIRRTEGGEQKKPRTAPRGGEITPPLTESETIRGLLVKPIVCPDERPVAPRRCLFQERK